MFHDGAAVGFCFAQFGAHDHGGMGGRIFPGVQSNLPIPPCAKSRQRHRQGAKGSNPTATTS